MANRPALMAPAFASQGRTMIVTLCYPRLEGRFDAVEVDLEDVRASDGIRVAYDFERDGWSIQQPSGPEFMAGESDDPRWKEVAFVQSWALDTRSET